MTGCVAPTGVEDVESVGTNCSSCALSKDDGTYGNNDDKNLLQMKINTKAVHFRTIHKFNPISRPKAMFLGPWSLGMIVMCMTDNEAQIKIS